MTCRMLVFTLLGLGLAGAAQAVTLEWDRNAEPDMRDYRIWACTTPSCVVVKSNATLKATVPQPPEGKVPSWIVPGVLLGKPGSIAISARDQSLNESALSVALPFDTAPPAAPANPRFK
ncbi:MAG: hypothetical protein H8K07_01665 [Nitrospira sp.]|nr:hypothetical protein [Nitrospira sp.]